ncbi:MAG: HAMP domain-containing protein [Frankiales bacterium]|nr:HAMP domain-containing protein [Frankiales bacterium]
MNARTPGIRLGIRLLLAMSLVVVAGAGTLLVVSLLTAPGVFQRHLSEAGVHLSDDVTMHVDEGFATALLVSITAGVLAAVAVAAIVSGIVAGRVTAPIQQIAVATANLAAGDYSSRVQQPRLGPELETLAESVNALAQRLEDNEARREQLVTDLAHELRTPITAITSTVEAIHDGVLPADDAVLDALASQSGRLARLVDDLSAISRADEHAFTIRPQPIDLADAARAAIHHNHVRFAAARVGLHTVAPNPVPVVADADRCVEIIDQLLENALRHTRPGDDVSLSVDTLKASGRVRVTDTGDGFPPGEAELIFERFHRGSASPGHGVGLTIARSLANAQDGSLDAVSPGPGLGATFTLSLPRREL